MTINEKIIPRQYTLEEMRKISGKKKDDIVKECNVSYKSIRNWETGTNIPNIINIFDLLKIYGFSFYELDLTLFYDEISDRQEKQELEQQQAEKNKRDREKLKIDLNHKITQDIIDQRKTK